MGLGERAEKNNNKFTDLNYADPKPGHTIAIFSTVWRHKMSYRKWKNGLDGMSRPLQTIWPVVPLPVRHSTYVPTAIRPAVVLS